MVVLVQTELDESADNIVKKKLTCPKGRLIHMQLLTAVYDLLDSNCSSSLPLLLKPTVLVPAC